jgi:hypothetical protein
MEIIKLLDGKCSNPYNLSHPDWCNDSRCLQIDHIHGGGTKIRRDLCNKNYDMYYKRILDEIKAGSKDYQLLCANCNWIKKDLDHEQNKSHNL